MPIFACWVCTDLAQDSHNAVLTVHHGLLKGKLP
eukprot:CAMPEP_0115717120 /NCGR_PEP_ID=MMETSP0272-20121206/76697_1 /TAXON_ID=71861 /ORGANISM="Scrippsiella trochoidea, Strain CCMP3099" /LENGTH=33 /DNA_ID= /DNA_START= /DNA_END= /DNA_ORIENTATION=